MLQAFDISAQGISAERRRIQVITNNIANMNTTRTPEGTPFRRQLTVMIGQQLDARDRDAGGVNVTAVVDDPSPFPLVYNPGHPDANAEGYVTMPNVNPISETVDLLAAARSYEANVSALNAVKGLLRQALTIVSE